jgi:hypothetical protein
VTDMGRDEWSEVGGRVPSCPVGGMRWPAGSVHVETYSLTKTQKVRAPIGWLLMLWCDHQKGVGRHLATWRLSDRACGPRVRCSPTGGKEIRCPASGKRWQGKTEYEIEGGGDGTSPTSLAGEVPRRGSVSESYSYCLATYGHLHLSFPSGFLLHTLHLISFSLQHILDLSF